MVQSTQKQSESRACCLLVTLEDKIDGILTIAARRRYFQKRLIYFYQFSQEPRTGERYA